VDAVQQRMTLRTDRGQAVEVDTGYLADGYLA
jgi:hypothetical protein